MHPTIRAALTNTGEWFEDWKQGAFLLAMIALGLLCSTIVLYVVGEILNAVFGWNVRIETWLWLSVFLCGPPLVARASRGPRRVRYEDIS